MRQRVSIDFHIVPNIYTDFIIYYKIKITYFTSFYQIFDSYQEAEDICKQIREDITGLSENLQTAYRSFISDMSIKFTTQVDRRAFLDEYFYQFIEQKADELLQYCSLSIYATPFIHDYFKLKLLQLNEENSNKLKSSLNYIIERQPLVNYQQLYKCFFGKEKENIQYFDEYINNFQQCKNYVEYYKNEYKLCMNFTSEQYKYSRIQYLAFYLSKKFPETACFNKIMILNWTQASYYWTQNQIQRNQEQNNDGNMFQTYLKIIQDNLQEEDDILLSKSFQLLNRQQNQLQLEYKLYKDYQQSQKQSSLIYLLNSAIQQGRKQQINNIVEYLLNKTQKITQDYLEYITNQFIINNYPLTQQLEQYILQICPYSLSRKYIQNIDKQMIEKYNTLQNIFLHQLYQNHWSQENITQAEKLLNEIGVQCKQSLKSLLMYPNQQFQAYNSNNLIQIPQQLQQYFTQQYVYLIINKIEHQSIQLYDFQKQNIKQTKVFPKSYPQSIQKLLVSFYKEGIIQDYWQRNTYEENLDLQSKQQVQQQGMQMDAEMYVWVQLLSSQYQ